MSVNPYEQPSPDWNMVTLRWAGVLLNGAPAQGTIDLTYNSPGPMLDDDPAMPLSIFATGVSIPIQTTTLLIDGQTRTVGYVSVSVPASNDPDILGGGGTYTFSERITGAAGRTGVSFVADINAPGGEIWLNKLPGTLPVPGTPLSVVYYSDFADLEERVTSLEETEVGATDLSVTRDASAVTVASSTGLDAVIPAADGTSAGLMLPTQVAKLAGIATGATANATDAQLRDRSTHTGTQPSTSISDFTEAVQDAVAALLAQGTNVTLSYNDAANTLTVNAAAPGLDAEAVRDAIGVAMVGAAPISVTVNDAADTITISTTATVNSTDAQLRDRSTHTGTQAISTVVNLQSTLDAKVALTGNQTIAGIKTFSSAPVVPSDSFQVSAIIGLSDTLASKIDSSQLATKYTSPPAGGKVMVRQESSNINDARITSDTTGTSVHWVTTYSGVPTFFAAGDDQTIAL